MDTFAGWRDRFWAELAVKIPGGGVYINEHQRAYDHAIVMVGGNAAAIVVSIRRTLENARPELTAQAAALAFDAGSDVAQAAQNVRDIVRSMR